MTCELCLLSLFPFFFFFLFYLATHQCRRNAGPVESEQGLWIYRVAFGLKTLASILQRAAFKELTDRQIGGYQNEGTKAGDKGKRNNSHLGSLTYPNAWSREVIHQLRSTLMLGRHPRHAGILPSSLLLLLQVLVVGHLLLFIGHVTGVHAGGMGHI